MGPSPAPPHPSPGIRRDLQGLRAVAIGLVVIAHARLGIAPGGFVGVDVFYVLSGYLITGLLLRELDESGHIGFVRFYARRLRRLLPALAVMLSVVSAVAFSLLSGPEAHAQLASGPYAATWTSNLYFAFSHLDYFDELAGHDLFLHTWSLGVEEQFYLIWPLLLAVLFRMGSRSGPGRGGARRVLAYGLAVALVSSLALCLFLTHAHPEAAFYLMPSRIWQLALGAVVLLAFRPPVGSGLPAPISMGRRASGVALAGGLLLIAGSALWLHPDVPYPGYWALAPSLGAALVIAAGHLPGLARGGLLASPPMVWLGDRSYSLYLWHWPVLMLGASLGVGEGPLPALRAIGIALLAATLSHRLVELPFWKGRWSRGEPRRVVLACLLAMAMVVLPLHYEMRELLRHDASMQLFSRWTADAPIIYRMGCDTWYRDAHVVPCLFGKRSAPRTVVSLGDSVEAQWFSMIPAIFPAPRWRTVVLTKSSCAMVDVDYYSERIRRTYHVCTRWRNAVLDDLDALRPDALVIGSDATYPFDEKQWVEGSARVLARVSKAARTVYLLPGTPTLGFDGPGCLARHLSPDGAVDPHACVAHDRLRRAERVAGYLRRAARRFPNVHVLDLNDLVCPRGRCNAASPDGHAVFRDDRHLTDSFVRAQIPRIRERFERGQPPVVGSRGPAVD